MNIDLVGAVLQGVLEGRRKQTRRTMKYLGRGGGIVSANTLLTAAGLAWGAYESWQASNAEKRGGALSSRAATLPPLPGTSSDGSFAARLVRLAIAAANADGSMTDQERDAIVAQARAAGASDSLLADLSRRAVLVDIVSGVTEAGEKASLYVTAFTIVRSDEQVSGSERVFLAQLANLLNLEPGAVARLEKTVAEGIDAEEP